MLEGKDVCGWFKTARRGVSKGKSGTGDAFREVVETAHIEFCDLC